MTKATRFLVQLSLVVVSARTAVAQSADDVIERHLAAMGGRPALAKIKSRSTEGTITLSTPVGAVAGTIETLNAAPNKSRTLIKVDLTALGAGPTMFDQRFDGTSGYVVDSIQGSHEMTGSLLESLRNGGFPDPFLNYKSSGASARLADSEQVGDRKAFVLVIDPPSGSVVRAYLDAETYLTLKVALTIEVPQLGREVEQTTTFGDYREVDGIKMPFELDVTSAVQNYIVRITKVQQNVPIDSALFSKPAPR